jgi:hypothetical protein
MPAKLPERGRFTEVVTGAAGKELWLDFENDLRMRLVCDQDMSGGKARTYGGFGQNMMDVTWARVESAKEANFLAVRVRKDHIIDAHRNAYEVRNAVNTIVRRPLQPSARAGAAATPAKQRG